MSQNIKIKQKISKWYRSFIRDKWGNLTNSYWNQMVKEEIEKLETQLQ